MDRLERDVALANHNDDSVPAYVEPEEHHAYAAEEGAPQAVLGERDDSSSAEPGDPDASDPLDGMRIVDPVEEDREMTEAVVDVVFSAPDPDIELDEQEFEDAEEEGERLGREHKRGNHAGAGATIGPLNEPAEPARHEQIREENTERYDPAPGPMDDI